MTLATYIHLSPEYFVSVMRGSKDAKESNALTAALIHLDRQNAILARVMPFMAVIDEHEVAHPTALRARLAGRGLVGASEPAVAQSERPAVGTGGPVNNPAHRPRHPYDREVL